MQPILGIEVDRKGRCPHECNSNKRNRNPSKETAQSFLSIDCLATSPNAGVMLDLQSRFQAVKLMRKGSRRCSIGKQWTGRSPSEPTGNEATVDTNDAVPAEKIVRWSCCSPIGQKSTPFNVTSLIPTHPTGSY
jgi:hypothetical protein